ncbi:homoserine O-acetyltransferase MetX [Rhodohalobacter halophilus]|uniref:homoserine O-acetyltransferase MetX n=1 Tax=Rhodohalobacter halophilus TaxID=1812810 RepID=UPI00083FBE3A|nr:homoserine O-acetyltransferase [Rhodohalobacter halophilus]
MNQGITQTRLEDHFITESGARLESPEVAYKTWGTLNGGRDNVVLICHALTGHAAADEWFPGIFGKGNICDPDQHFIICINVPGSCYGSVGPQSVNPQTGRPYRNDFPELTIRDMVRFQQQFLDQLGINGIELVIGGSMGGMQALEFIIMDRRSRSAVLIAMGKAHTPWAIGISHAQRTAITNDPGWKDGNYELNEGPFRGVAAARMMAMITYRAPEDYNRKFGRKLQNEDGQFQIESYLNHQGEKLAKRMDAHTYITLTKAMDSHDISRGRSDFEQVLDRVEIPVQVIGIRSDHLYPIAEQKELADLLPNGRYAEIDSPAGHDGFLIEFDQLNEIIIPFVKHKELQFI